MKLVDSAGGRRPDTVFLNLGRYFVVIKWRQADRKALQDFVREMEQRLGSAAKPQ